MLREANKSQAKFFRLLESLQNDETAFEKFEDDVETTLKAFKAKVAQSSGQESSTVARTQATSPVEKESSNSRLGQTLQQLPATTRHSTMVFTPAQHGAAIASGRRHQQVSSSSWSTLPEVESDVANEPQPVRPRTVLRKGSFAASDLDTQPGDEVQGRSSLNPKRFLGPAPEVGSSLQTKTKRAAYEAFSLAFVVYQGEKDIKRVFCRGSVIAVFWHENYGSSLPSKMKGAKELPTPGRKGPGFVSVVGNGEFVYSYVRRFVVVNQRQGFSTAIPISTYGGKGLSKRAQSIKESEQLAHTIVYTLNAEPVRLVGEPDFTKEPICIELTAPGETLSASSRLYYAKPQTIDHNIKIKHLGHVVPRDIGELMASYWRENGRDITKQ